MLSALEARIRIVQSPSNARVKALRRATEHPAKALRVSAGSDAPPPLIAVEGFHLVAEALLAGLAPATIFLREGEERATLATLLHTVAGRAALPAHTELLALPAALLHSLLDTVTPQPLVALVPAPAAALSGTSPALVLVLCALQDPGNVGTLLRSAVAFGATGALLLPGTASPWSGKCLRASAGTAFHLPLAAVRDAGEAKALMQERGIRSYAAVPRGGEPPERLQGGSRAVWIGNEGAGLTSEEMAACHARVSLSMLGAAESLNAAVAGSLLLYEAARARAASASKRA